MSGTAAKIFLFMFAFAVAMNLIFPNSKSLMTDMIGALQSGKSLLDVLLFSRLAESAFLLGVTGAAVGAGLAFGNPYATFAGAVVLLFTYVTLPLSIFQDNAMNQTFVFLVGGGMAILYMFAVLSFYRGGTEL